MVDTCDLCGEPMKRPAVLWVCQDCGAIEASCASPDCLIAHEVTKEHLRLNHVCHVPEHN